MTRQGFTEAAMSIAALTIRVTFATLAAVQLIGTGLVIRTAVVAVLITIATGAAVRVDRALR